MLLRFISAVIVSVVQIAVLWLMFYVAALIAFKVDPQRHHGIAWGLLIYCLFLCSAILIAAVNLSTALVNRNWFRWLIMKLSVVALLVMFGVNPLLHPYRMLLISLIILLLTAGKGLLDALVLRLIPERNCHFESSRVSLRAQSRSRHTVDD